MGLNKQKDKSRKEHHVEITKELKEFLDGLLLGDGNLTIGKGSKGAYYSHGDKNFDYIKWLSNKFRDFGIKQCGKITILNKIVYRYKTLTYIEFNKITKEWYPNGKKQISKNLIVTPTILRNWYIGDGNFSDSPIINSKLFSFEDLKRIANQIRRLGIKLTLRQFKDRKRIRISKKSEKRFLAYLLSDIDYIPPNYNYKFFKHKRWD